ncbi:MAG: hypothetical protein JSR91_17635 [Proteobacteria bacterium]|nr:hypothetical protein [Pseudomonadota bacterium]
MVDYKVGFKKPPKHRQFKPGESGNPDGRAKRKPTPIGDRINEIMDATMTYRERGQTKVASRREVSLLMLVSQAAGGDVRAAEGILDARQRAERQGGGGAKVIRVKNWLPDRPEQTADEKTKAVHEGRHAEPMQQATKSNE